MITEYSVYLIYDLIINRCIKCIICFKFVCINDCCVYWLQIIKHTSRFSKKSWVIHCNDITWWHHPESAFCSRRKCFLSIISNEIFCPDLILECYRIILLLSDVVVRWNQIHFSLLKLLTVKFPQWGILQWLWFQKFVFVTRL